MDRKQRELLENLRDIRESLNSDFIKNDKENQFTSVEDVIFVGNIKWKDEINGKELSEKLYIVQKIVTVTDEYGKETTKEVSNYYLGDECIGGFLGDSKKAILNSNFEMSEPDKAREIRNLLENIDDKELEENSLKNLEQKDIAEIAVALGINPEDIKKIAEVDIEQLESARRELDGKNLDNTRTNLFKKEEKDEGPNKKIEKISARAEIDVNQKVTDKDTIASLLGEEAKDCEKIDIVDSDKLDNRNGNSTKYAFVGVKKDGSKQKLNGLQQLHGIHTSVEIQQVNRDGSNVEKKEVDSLYTIKGSKDGNLGIKIGAMGTIEASYVRIPEQDNQIGLGVPIETQSIRPTTREVRELANERRNPRVLEETQRAKVHEKHGDDEISINDIDDNEHNDECQKKDVDNQYFQNCVDEIWNGKVKDVFTRGEVEETLRKTMDANKDKLSFEEIVEKTQQNMEYDANMIPSPFKSL